MKTSSVTYGIQDNDKINFSPLQMLNKIPEHFYQRHTWKESTQIVSTILNGGNVFRVLSQRCFKLGSATITLLRSLFYRLLSNLRNPSGISLKVIIAFIFCLPVLGENVEQNFKGKKLSVSSMTRFSLPECTLQISAEPI